MKRCSFKFRTAVAVILAMIMMAMPVCAEGENTPSLYFNNTSSAIISIDFDMNNVVYCGLLVTLYSHGSGVSGMMKLYDSAGTCLDMWYISDYVEPIGCENTYQGKYGETYTVTFEGYVYGKKNLPADRLELSVTGTCKD